MRNSKDARVFRSPLGLRIFLSLFIAASFGLAVYGLVLAVSNPADPRPAGLIVNGTMSSILLIAYRVFIGGKVVIDAVSIRHSHLFRARRIYFAEVTDYKIERARVRITSETLEIKVGPMHAGIRNLGMLVEKRLAEAGKTKHDGGDTDEKGVEETVFRYSRAFKWFARIELALLLAIVVLMGAMFPGANRFGWTICFVPMVMGTIAAAYFLFRTTMTLEFLDDFLFWQWGRRTLTIPYDAIDSVTVKKTWNGFQYLELRWEDNRLRLPGALYPFDRLVDQLAYRTQVSWAGTWPLRFPVAMRFRTSAEQFVGLPMGLFFTVLSVYFVIDAPQLNWFSIAIGVMGGAMGLCLIACVTVLQMTSDSPRKIQLRRRRITFGRHRFAVVDFRKCRTYRARDVTNVYLRVDDSFSTTYTLEITLGERRFVFQNFGHDVPLVPLYHLLREAYCGEPKQMAGSGPVEISQDQSECSDRSDE